ncbi:MAG: hypothetical protein ABSF78_15960 [Candidatus Acidiferrales bacterium]
MEITRAGVSQRVSRARGRCCPRLANHRNHRNRGQDSLTIEITGTEDKIDSLLEVLRPLGLIEVVRTGQVAMRRGTKATVPASKEKAAAVIDDENVSYSV